MNKLICLIGILIGVSTANYAQDDSLVDWPKVIESGDFTITLYRPDNSSYIDNELTSNLAFSVKKGNAEPQFGMLWTTSLLDVDRESRQAVLVSVKVEEVRLSQEVSASEKKQLEELLNKEIPEWNIEFALDDLLATLEEVSVIPENLKNDPPNMIFAHEPTALIMIDGKPMLKEAEKGYELVVNTGAFIAREVKSDTYYLNGDEFWYKSKAVIGPWETTKKVPSKVKSLKKKSESEKIENEKEDSDDNYNGKAPNILVAMEPTELIVFEGDPKYSPLQKTNLLFVENTKSDIFMNVSNQTYYLLISGRWFTTKDITSSWEYIASEELPEDFKNIPSDSKKANVLSNVAGTPEAKNAVYDAQIPQTAAVNRDTKANKVTYNGNPEFKNVEGLKLQYAVNTESAVFKDNNTYYLCDNAVWFKASTPNGPWQVADERPTEIEKIPAENPRYNTKYVYIYETSPTVVYVGYTPGYYGSYVYGPTVIYGTGYYYNPWYNGYYYHHHYTYGFAMHYHPYYGWSVRIGYGSPYGWYGHAYWGHSYHHWGPPYYRPPYYRGNYYRRPSHPIYTGRGGVNPYKRPSTYPGGRENGPSTRPATRKPSNPPTTRPSNPGNTRPTNPNISRPTNPNVTRPSNNSPTTRPSAPSRTYPSNTYRPNTRPTTRPSTPVRSQSARPANRPTARPTGRGFRGN